MAVKISKYIKPSSYNGKYCYDVRIDIEGLMANPNATRRTATYRNLNNAKDITGRVIPQISDIGNDPKAPVYRYTFTRLLPSTEYSFAINIIDSNGYIALSNSSFGFNTPDDPSLDLQFKTTGVGYSIEVYTPNGTETTHLVKVYEDGVLISTIDEAWGKHMIERPNAVPGTTYTVKAEMFKADGSLLNSVTKNMTTAKATLKVTANNSSSTEHSVSVKATFDADVNYERHIRWECSFSETPNAIVSSIYGSIPQSAASDEVVFSNLIPDKQYSIKASLLCGANEVLNDTAYTAVRTEAMAGSYSVLEKSSSVIVTRLNGMSRFPYDIQVKFQYKRATESSWTDLNVQTIPKETSKEVRGIFSGLTQATSYNLKAEVYKVGGGSAVLMKAFNLTASTMSYVPAAKPTPFITSSLIIPHAAKGLLYWGHDDASLETFTFHLYRSTTETGAYTDLGEIAEDEYVIISGTAGSTYYYKIGAVDGNGGVHNLTQPFKVKYITINGSNGSAGDPVDITSDEIQLISDALMKLYEFKKATDSVTSEQTQYYTMLKTYLPQTAQGLLIQGGSTSAYDQLNRLLQALSTRSVPFVPGLVAKGQPIRATTINALGAYTMMTLEDLRD